MKKIVKTILTSVVVFFTTLSQVNAQAYIGSNAFLNYRIDTSEVVKYYIDENSTNNYAHTTSAYENAIRKTEQIPNTTLNFERVYNEDDALITMESVQSPKEEWIGLCTTRYSIGSNSQYYQSKGSEILMNESVVEYFKASKNHVYQVALHEFGHALGLKHQPQEEEKDTIMIPSMKLSIPGRTDFTSLDKSNIQSQYKLTHDWRNHWAKDSIRSAMHMGWVNTTEFFRPNDPITRAEFIKITNKAFNFTEVGKENFKDVNPSHWYYKDVCVALDSGYISKVQNFRPNDPITREEVASIITSITNTKDTNLDKIKKYKDYKNISTWAKSSVEGAVEKGFMGVGTTTFNPQENITRAEAVTTLIRIK